MARPETARTPDTRPATLDRLLTTRELIARTSLSRSTLWRMARTGALPAPIQLTPSRIAWRESQIAEWLDARRPRPMEAV